MAPADLPAVMLRTDDGLVEAIYDSAADPAALEQVVTRICDQMRATAAVNFNYGPPRPQLWHSTGINPQTFRDYAS